MSQHSTPEPDAPALPPPSPQLAFASRMSRSSSTPSRRSTISTAIPPSTTPFASRTRHLRTNNASTNAGSPSCTHLTMTRLYSKEFRCQLCLRVGSFGWLYRCVQDRELLLEDDIDQNIDLETKKDKNPFRQALAISYEKLEDMCEIFGYKNPRKRGPAARLNRLSLFDEMSEEQMRSYTPAQLSQILAQRQHVLEVVSSESTPDPKTPEAFYRPSFTSQTENEDPFSIPEPEKNPKPWLPIPGGECQFKCCHSCRPHSKDRSFLSLDGIVNGDVPASAVSGYGFHLNKNRPVALIQHVQNLGLRPNPPPRPLPKDEEEMKEAKKRRRMGMGLRQSRGSINLGLGIISGYDDAENQVLVSETTLLDNGISVIDFASPDTEVVGLSPLQSLPPTHHLNPNATGNSIPRSSTPHPIAMFPRQYRPLPILSRRRHSLSTLPTTINLSHASHIALPSQTESELTFLTAGQTPVCESFPSFVIAPPSPRQSVSLTPRTIERLEMETWGKMLDGELKKVDDEGEVKVDGGVAVTEEAVEVGMADVVTRS